MGEVVKREALSALSKALKKNGKKIVTTNGCFDILHVGHVRALKQSQAQGDVLIVGLNSDESVRRLKGPARPIVHEEDRAELLASLACVDYVTIFPEDTPVEFLKLVQPDVHVKSADYTPERLEETPIVEAGGGKVVILHLVPGRSTTNIVERIKETTCS